MCKGPKVRKMKRVTPSSIDANEIAYYTGLANRWWDLDGPFWPLHTLNRVRMQWVIRQLVLHKKVEQSDYPLSSFRVLDIGCGGGILSEALARAGAEVYGIDVVERNICVAQHHANQQGLPIHYQLISAEELVTTGQQFDIVFNMEVVEHVAQLDIFMTACCALIKPGGAQFIATINRNWLAYLVAIFGAERMFQLLPKGTHQYRKLCKPSELRALLQESEMSISAQTGVAVNPFTHKMRTFPFNWVNYMIFAEKYE
jgi:2-polyprenyl-6-hydroxyphenyl methylase/3-demethylubiquinone-9 3-methyltransferase